MGHRRRNRNTHSDPDIHPVVLNFPTNEELIYIRIKKEVYKKILPKLKKFHSINVYYTKKTELQHIENIQSFLRDKGYTVRLIDHETDITNELVSANRRCFLLCMNPYLRILKISY